MSYKVIVDSCGELTREMKEDGRFCNIPLTLSIDGYEIVDDETFDQADFLRRVSESPNVPRSACPSPQAYMELICGDAPRVYIVTLSAELSGSYQSAVVGKQMYEEKYGAREKEIYVFNSRSASIGQTLIAMKIAELEEAGCSFEEVVSRTEAYIREQRTFFVLETLEHLRKNGRISNLKLTIANMLKIRPVMGSTPEGAICQLAQGIGMNKALETMVRIVVDATRNCEEKILCISHCNCAKRAEHLCRMFLEKASFLKVIVLETAGVSSLYAADGGIIVAV